MIPIAILLGLLGGLIPRYRWWSIPVVGIIWSVTLAVGGDPEMSSIQIWTAGFALGTVNAALGVVIGWTALAAARAGTERIRG